MEQRSGFALEAKEMAVVLAQGAILADSGTSAPSAGTTPRSFVCIDEFGKGTEDAHATALCAALLHRLDQVRLALTWSPVPAELHARRFAANESRAPVSLSLFDANLILRRKCQARCGVQMTFNGVFATHQHDLFQPHLGLFSGSGGLQSLLRRTRRWQVCTRPATAAEVAAGALAEFAEATGTTPHVSSYTVAEGVDTSSLAFQVAFQQVCSHLSSCG